LLLGSLFEAQHRYAAAESALALAVGHGADSLETTLEIAFCREQAGDALGAEHAARDALEIAPHSPRSLNFLGYLLADHDKSLAANTANAKVRAKLAELR